ncbi:MAG TPA: ATP synthase F0 subunit B [Polyangiaceae bacterium]|jgi:F-type H+-transporting ATPase subunit b|nr:ATP synthase F0 subunit B [Polyangiaceae bacterium]
MLLASIDDGLLAAAPQAIQVDFDATFLVQFVLFIGLTLVLKPLLFDPMLKLFEERERRTDGAKLEARKIDERSTSALTKYETEMAKARASANAEREKMRAEALRKEQEILGEMRVSATKTLEDGKKGAAAEAERVRATLRAQGAVIARELAGRVLGREVQS